MNMVVFKFMPLVNDYIAPTTAAGIPTANIPTLMVCKDYTDAVTPVSVNQVAEYGNCKTYQFNRPVTIKLIPASQNIMHNVGGTNAAANPKYKQWLDCLATNIGHYGLKGCVTSLPASSTTFYMKVQAKYYMSFKNLR